MVGLGQIANRKSKSCPVKRQGISWGNCGCSCHGAADERKTTYALLILPAYSVSFIAFALFLPISENPTSDARKTIYVVIWIVSLIYLIESPFDIYRYSTSHQMNPPYVMFLCILGQSHVRTYPDSLHQANHVYFDLRISGGLRYFHKCVWRMRYTI